MDPDELLTLVEAHLVSVLGHDSGRASVSFLGTDRIDVLRFGPDQDGLVRYATLGMSRAPMSGSSELLTEGPRAELVLSVHGAHDTVLRRLGALAASPAVEGVVITPGAGLDLGEPLWDGQSELLVRAAGPEEASRWQQGLAEAREGGDGQDEEEFAVFLVALDEEDEEGEGDEA